METKEIRINEIDVDTSLFLRDGYDEDAIERYTILFESGTQKPILVSEIADRNYKLIDGFHRLKAAQKLKWERIQANVEKIDPDEWRGRAIQENNDATRGIFLTAKERNNQIGKLIEAGKTQEYMAGKFGVSRQRITQIINDDEILKKQATSQINITSVNEFLEGVKQDDIANNLGITQGRVSQILKDFKKDIRNQYLSGLPISAIVEKAKENKYHLTEETCKENLLTMKTEWLGWNQLILGDCLEKLKDIPDGSVDMILTDPPYGINYVSWDKKQVEGDDNKASELLDNALKITDKKLKEKAHIFCFASWKNYPEVSSIISKYFKIKTVLVWIKNESSMGTLHTWTERHEFIIHAIKGDAKIFLKDGQGRPDNFFISDGHHYNKVAGTNHPTEKPVDLCAELIGFGSEKSGVILDPFAGSGSSLIAAMKQERRWYGIEIDEKYIPVFSKRMNEVE